MGRTRAGIAVLTGVVFTFDTVAQMVATPLEIGSEYRTLGYYTVGDGGGASYVVQSDDSSDAYVNHLVNTTDTAILLSKGSILIKQAGAVGDGVVDDAPAIQAAIDHLSTTGGTVSFTGGVYRVLTGINMRPDVHLVGTHGATIKQAAGANLSAVVNFDTYLASNAGLYGLTIDGNKLENLEGYQYNLALTSQNYCTFIGNTFINGGGMGVHMQSGSGSIVDSNVFSNIRETGVILISSTPYNTTRCKVINNNFDTIGLHAVNIVWCDENLVSNNRIRGTVVNSTVSTNGLVVTWVSGTDFSSLRSGMIMRISLVEYQIGSVDSSTQITLTSSAGVQASALSTNGSGDLVNVDASSNTIISDNQISGGMSGGIVIHTEKGTSNTVLTSIIGNILSSIGGGGIMLQALSGGTSLDSATVNGNIIAGCGVGGSANPSWGNAAIIVLGSLMGNALITNNICRDFGAGTQTWGVYLDSNVPNGSVTVGDNLFKGNTLGETSGYSWTTYVPTCVAGTGTFTTVTPSGRHRKIGKIVHFQAKVVINNNGTAGGSVNIGLPFPCTSGGNYILTGREDAVSGHMLQGKVTAGSSTVLVVKYDGSYPGATSAQILVSGTYESN